MFSQRLKQRLLTRRTVLQMVAVAGAAGALGWPFFGSGRAATGMVRRSQAMLGTVVNLTVYGRDRDQAAAAADATLARMAELEGELSRFRPDSQVGRLNRDGVLPEAGADLLQVLELAQKVSLAGSGAFDITILPLLAAYQGLQARPGALEAPNVINALETPAGKDAIAAARELVDYRRLQIDGRRVSLERKGMGISLDGIGKGHIVDQGAATLAAHGFGQVYVEAGGDLLILGDKPGQEPWRIGIRNPRQESARPLPVIVGSGPLAVATSGDYQQPFSPDFRYHHIIDPRTGFSAPELAAATVTAPSAALADALATAAMVLGSDRALELLGNFPGCEGYFVGKDLTTYRSEGFPA